ncbi:MAG: hypothetical protein ACMZI2_06235 [Candidatus Symbiodolus clandestinus]
MVLNNLFEAAYGERSQELTLDERQARCNLVTAIISGTTQALGGDAALANTAAAIEMENNYLSQAQYNQKKQALSECENFIQNAGIQAKWDLINIGQEACFAAGMIAGVPASLYEAVEAIANAAATPRETYLSLKTLFNSDNILGTVSEAVKQSYIARIDKMNEEYEKAGFTCALNAGAEGTKLIADIASLVATGVGVAKGAVTLTDFGIKLSKQGLKATKTGNLAKRAATLSKPVAKNSAAVEKAIQNAHIPVKSVKDSASSSAAVHSATESLTRNQAYSSVSGLNLNKSLASQEQLSALASKGGKVIAGYGATDTLRDAPRLAAKYGGKPSEWSKVSSLSHTAADGTAFEIHAYQNSATGQLVEPKTIQTNKIRK